MPVPGIYSGQYWYSIIEEYLYGGAGGSLSDLHQVLVSAQSAVGIINAYHDGAINMHTAMCAYREAYECFTDMYNVDLEEFEEAVDLTRTGGELLDEIFQRVFDMGYSEDWHVYCEPHEVLNSVEDRMNREDPFDPCGVLEACLFDPRTTLLLLLDSTSADTYVLKSTRVERRPWTLEHNCPFKSNDGAPPYCGIGMGGIGGVDTYLLPIDPEDEEAV